MSTQLNIKNFSIRNLFKQVLDPKTYYMAR